MKLITERSLAGVRGVVYPPSDVPPAPDLPNGYRRTGEIGLPRLSELEVVRHYTNLSRLNYSVDTHFYPLGSCTMKYNPKSAERGASLFADLHPMVALLPGGEGCVQGILGVIHELSSLLAEITGMAEVSCQPLAGAHGELTGLLLIAAWHRSKGSDRRYVIVPDTSHGTNPASAAMAGFETVTIPSDRSGEMDMAIFRERIDERCAAVMMTSPNTLGIFSPRVKEICDIAHRHGALVYYDGANLNAILGKVRPGDIGFDVVHVNLHKSFGTPHGCGGPGAGPVGVVKKLVPFIPAPRIVRKRNGLYAVEHENPEGIGRISTFFGNVAVLVKAYAYLLMLGREGLIAVSEQAVLSANYILARLKDLYEPAVEGSCMHECVLSARRQAEKGVHAIDIAKFLIDKGFHPPTVYFPLTVKEAIMIEPTETETLETLDRFIEAMREAARLAETDPERLRRAPETTPVSRLDEAKGARELVVTAP